MKAGNRYMTEENPYDMMFDSGFNILEMNGVVTSKQYHTFRNDWIRQGYPDPYEYFMGWLEYSNYDARTNAKIQHELSKLINQRLKFPFN
jgi:hypothetical protein